MSRLALALAAAALFALAFAGPAHAKKYTSTSVAAPAYPESSLAMAVKGKPRARGITRLAVSGSNASQDDGDGLAFDYTLDVYVLDRRAFPTCAPSLREANSRLAQLPGKVEHIGFGLSVPASGPFSETITYRAESFRKVIFCAYTTYVIDDAAMGSLKHDLRKAKRKKRRG